MKINWRKLWLDYDKWYESGRDYTDWAAQKRKIRSLVNAQLKAKRGSK